MLHRDPSFLPQVVLTLAQSEAFAVTDALIRMLRAFGAGSNDWNPGIFRNLAVALRESTDARTFLRMSVAYLRSDGFFKWLKSNQAAAEPWTERALILASSDAEMTRTVAFVLVWRTLGLNSVQMSRAVALAKISLESGAHRALVLDAIRLLHRTSPHYTNLLPWQADWGNAKGATIDWPMSLCLREITGRFPVVPV
jgi:hypothetical protein